MFVKAVAITAIDRWNIENIGIPDGLLNSGLDGMAIIFRFNNCDRNIGLIIQNIVRPLLLAPAGQIAFDIDFSFRKGDFLPHLRFNIPARPL